MRFVEIKSDLIFYYLFLVFKLKDYFDFLFFFVFISKKAVGTIENKELQSRIGCFLMPLMFDCHIITYDSPFIFLDFSL